MVAGSGYDNRTRAFQPISTEKMCAKGTQWYLFDRLLDMIVVDHLEKEGFESSGGFPYHPSFEKKLYETSNADMIQWVSDVLEKVWHYSCDIVNDLYG